MISKATLWRAAAALYLLGHGLLASAQDEVLEQAAKLIAAKQFQSAYSLLEPLESQRSGEDEYDMLLGLSAIDSGHVTRGVFALERVLARHPENGNARAHIARAYFLLGEQEAARAEFRNVLAQKPPEDMTKVINRYMSAIDKSQGLSSTYSAYLEAGIGHDSNVNSATTASSVTIMAIPGLGGLDLLLGREARERSDNFASLAGGISFRSPQYGGVTVFGSANASQRYNHQESRFDLGTLDFNLGLRYIRHVDTFTLAAQSASLSLDHDVFRRVHGLNGQWQRDLDDKNQINAFVQVSRLEYPDNDIRNANRYVGGGGWAHVFNGDLTPLLFMSAYMGQERTLDRDWDFFSHHLYGARLGGQLALTPKLVTYATSGYEYRRYDERDALFQISRGDKQFDLNLGLRYLPGYNWIIKPQLTYIRNDSNIDLNRFDRYMLSFSIRREFNW